MALEIAPERIVKKGRLEPGKMFLVDMQKGRIVGDDEIKHELATAHPYGEWLREKMVTLADLPPAPELPPPDHDGLLQRQMAFGYTLEDLKYIVAPMGSATVKRPSAQWVPTRPWRCSRIRAAAVQLFQATLRSGHESAAGRHP